MPEAIVVGAGPNGLAAAVVLARAGVNVTVIEAADRIGGGTGSGEYTLPGLLHDHCAAFHPIAAGSPVLHSLDLARYGLRWRWADIECAHPMTDVRGAALHRSVADTVSRLGPDGRTWHGMFGSSARGYPVLAADILRPLPYLPAHPMRLARFGALAALPASVLAARLDGQARSLFGGVAMHAFQPLHRIFSSAIALGLIAAAHHDGWPVAEGGSHAITRALAAVLTEAGGKIETGVRVRAAASLPKADIVLYDLAPSAVAEILSERLPPRAARAYRRFRHGPAVFKVDYAVADGIPWRYPDARRAGTVHLGGSFAEMTAAARTVHRGQMPERPFVLVGQQYLADPGRSNKDVHPVYAYAHVPNGYTGDATEAIIARIEQFAPGFQDRILATSVCTPADFAIDNPNFVGGDIVTGAKTPVQMLRGPRLGGNPYRTGVPGSYLCSAATPPGPGTHGMCGANAAALALHDLSTQ